MRKKRRTRKKKGTRKKNRTREKNRTRKKKREKKIIKDKEKECDEEKEEQKENAKKCPQAQITKPTRGDHINLGVRIEEFCFSEDGVSGGARGSVPVFDEGVKSVLLQWPGT